MSIVEYQIDSRGAKFQIHDQHCRDCGVFVKRSRNKIGRCDECRHEADLRDHRKYDRKKKEESRKPNIKGQCLPPLIPNL